MHNLEILQEMGKDPTLEKMSTVNDDGGIKFRHKLFEVSEHKSRSFV